MSNAAMEPANIPIYHMASFSRSGETLMLRCLNAHPQIEVVHQIRHRDTPKDVELFNFLMEYPDKEIPSDHPKVSHRSLKPNSVLLLKNAVWCHATPRQGFTLVRNPFSVVTSAYRDTTDEAQQQRQRRQQLRWAHGIDPLTLPMAAGESTLHGFLALYARKMLQDWHDGLPFVRYEDFVTSPETILRKIVTQLGLDWSPRVLSSHEDYHEGQIGHGGIKLWQPINAGSMDKYSRLSPSDKATVYAMTNEVLRRYGYTWDGESLDLTKSNQML